MLKLGKLKKQKQEESKPVTYSCLNIYPKEKGGVKYENMEAVDPQADLWLKAETGKYWYLQVWDPDKNKLVAYRPLPEVVAVGADYVARMLSCPYIRLKELKTGMWGIVQSWIPVIVLGLGLLFLIILSG